MFKYLLKSRRAWDNEKIENHLLQIIELINYRISLKLEDLVKTRKSRSKISLKSGHE